jgi:hypothetical protein
MSIAIETSTIEVSIEERTRQISISTPKGADPTLAIYRERVSSTSDGTILGIEQVGVVERSLTDVAATEFAAAGMTLTGAQIASILASIADQLRREEMGGDL